MSAAPQRVPFGWRGMQRGGLLYLQLATLMIVTFVLGRLGVGAVRYGFVVGCVALGYQAWRMGPAKHLEIVIILYVWAPFLRRVVDLTAGFNPNGMMLVGPVLALLPPCVDLYNWLVTGRLHRGTRMLGPYILMGLCLSYGFSVSIAQGDMMPAALGLTKFLPGMIYGLWFVARGDETPNVIDGATRGLLIAMPAAGLYGIYQYFLLPDWDANWMVMTAVVNTSQGFAEAEKVRVFGPMNSAASFGHYLLAGLLMIGFARNTWRSLLLCLPIITSMMLSSYRTGWIGLAVGLFYCWARSSTRRRAELITVFVVLGSAVILSATSFGDGVMDRLATFGAPSNDGSGHERLGQYASIIDHAAELVVGLGIGGLGPFGDAKPRITIAPIAVDGSFIDAILLMGLLVGGLYIISLFWATLQSLRAAFHTRDRRLVAAAAVVLANFSAIPLSSITRGEVGVLFWAFVGTISARPMPFSRNAPTTPSPVPMIVQS